MTSFKSALRHNMTYSMDIMNDKDFEEYCKLAGIESKHRGFVSTRFNKIGSYTATNGNTGATYIAHALPHTLRVQAV